MLSHLSSHQCPHRSRFRPSVRAAPTMPSADFCRALRASSPVLSRCCFRNHDTWQISRGKTQILPRIDAGFTKCTLVGVATHAVDRGLRGHVPARPECITPHIRFLFITLRFRLGLPPHPASRRRTCPLASLRLYKPGTGTFTRLDSCHARHTRLSSGALRGFIAQRPLERWVGPLFTHPKLLSDDIGLRHESDDLLLNLLQLLVLGKVLWQYLRN